MAELNVTKANFEPFLGMRFTLELACGDTKELWLNEYASVTDFTIRVI